MKAVLIASLLMALSACAFPVLDQINYRGTPLPKNSDSYAVAKSFARYWAAESGLEVAGETRPSLGVSDTSIIELKKPGAEGIHATVLVDHGSIFATVAPASKVPQSEDIVAGAVRAFSNLYPQTHFERSESHEGLFAP